MFPNPQDALPFPPRPNLEQYKKLAKDLVKACSHEAAARNKVKLHEHDSGGDNPQNTREDAISDWVLNWLETLARLQGFAITHEVRTSIERRADPIEVFARSKLLSTGDLNTDCSLADAQFIIARSHGFLSWLRLAQHITELARASSPVSNFESAADAIVNGDLESLQHLLSEDPHLIRARSNREHNATLLHYVSANGVENFRQKTPQNAVEIAEILLSAGAEVDATAAVYRGACTTLELVATSVHPLRAGVQNALIENLLDYGAAVDGAPGGPGMIIHCIANGCPQAAELLANRGAQLTLEGAAALGRLEVVTSFFDKEGRLNSNAKTDQMTSGFLRACAYGRNDVVEFLLQRGVDVSAHQNDGQSGLHWAAIGGQMETIKLLLERRAPLEMKNMYGGTVLGQTLWSAAHGGDPDTFAQIIETLIAAGAKLGDRHPPINARIDKLLEKYGSFTDETWSWYGEQPKKRFRALSALYTDFADSITD
jgi:ankyrin repeat protein